MLQSAIWYVPNQVLARIRPQIKQIYTDLILSVKISKIRVIRSLIHCLYPRKQLSCYLHLQRKPLLQKISRSSTRKIFENSIERSFRIEA